ncbi:MAG TPA: MFS transporter [Solirubrobacteraceae bacterium]|nr:MFS transporter [Solirubrobacteraceae bacterium]
MLNLTSSAPTPLRTRNYRLYFSGQLISVPGTWLQTVAQAWLVLELSSSGSALGVTVALQTVPVLVLGAWTGSVADRIDKRKLLLGTQATQGLLAAVLGTLALTGVVQLWMVWILALGLGITRSFDTPTRQAFVSELVEGPSLARAIGINSTVVSAARMIGPAAGGVIIAAVGVGWCFLLNAASFAGPLIGLLAMDASKLIRPEMPATRKPHAVRAGLRYVRNRRDLLIPLLMMALVGTLAFEFQVTIPLMAHSAFHLGATGFGLLYAAMGAGAVVSGITLAGKVPGRVRTLAISAAAFGIALAAAALVPTPAGAAICLGFAGAASVVYSSSTNGTLQIRADPSMRGRVVALYIMAFMGSTAVGGPLVGVVGQVFGPRASLWVGAIGCAAAVLLAIAYELRWRGRREPARTRRDAVAAS